MHQHSGTSAAPRPAPPRGQRRGLQRLLAFGVVIVAALSLSATPATAAVEEASAITLSSTELQTDSTLTVDWVTDTPDDTNWIGIYRESDGTPDGDPASRIWDYAPGTEGSLDFAMATLQPGSYVAWFLAQDGYEALAEPVSFVVTAAPAPEPADPITPIETDASTDGVIHREGFGEDPAAEAPAGWTITADDATSGTDAWRGWELSTRQEWNASVDGMRNRFGRVQDVLAVADAGQFAGESFSSILTSAPLDVSDEGPLRLTFDSHYRGAAGQSGIVRASFDGAEPIELLRLDDTVVASGYDGMQMNAAQDVAVPVPAGAKTVVLSWEFTAAADGQYWAIDSVALHRTQKATAQDATSAWVVSDIQGHPQDLAHGLHDLSALSPDADGLLMVGDIVASGTASEWDEVYAVMEQSAGIRPRQTVAAIGNHERYAAGGFEANRDRFLAFAERDRVWGEYVLEGPSGDHPVITVGQDAAGPTDVPMSEEQLTFLEERLAHWTELDKQIVVMTHFPLGDTVSASWIPWYHDHHQHNDRLTALFGAYPNVIVLSGHTHYPAELGDWAVQRRTEGGHPDGFRAVNTLAVQTEWDAVGENTAGITEVTTRDVNRGLTLVSYGDRVVITAHDFAADSELRQVTIPNPLVPFDAVPGAPVDSTDPADPTDPIDPADPVDPPVEPVAPVDPDGNGEAAPGSYDGLAVTGAEPAAALLLLAVLMLGLGTALAIRRARRRSI